LLLLGAGVRGLLHAGKAIEPDDQPNQAAYATWILAIAAIVVDSLLSGVLVMPQSQMTLVLVIGAAMGWVRSQRLAGNSQVRIATGIAGAALLLSALCMLGFVAAPDAVRKWEGGPLTPAEQAYNPGVHWPRLWEAGFF
jgi:hypothetical protein